MLDDKEVREVSMDKTKKNSSQIIKGFLQRKQEYYKLKKDIKDQLKGIGCVDKENSFAELCGKYKMRDFSANTRMNIKNQDYFEVGYQCRLRMVNYWKNNIVAYHLPPINIKKRKELFEIKKSTTKF